MSPSLASIHSMWGGLPADLAGGSWGDPQLWAPAWSCPGHLWEAKRVSQRLQNQVFLKPRLRGERKYAEEGGGLSHGDAGVPPAGWGSTDVQRSPETGTSLGCQESLVFAPDTDGSAQQRSRSQGRVGNVRKKKGSQGIHRHRDTVLLYDFETQGGRGRRGRGEAEGGGRAGEG